MRKLDSRLQLNLFKCTLCRRAFFSRHRLEIHTQKSHNTRRRRNTINQGPLVRVLNRKKRAGRTQLGKKLSKSLSTRESILNTLISNWPPEKAYPKICKKHRLSGVKAQKNIKSMVSSRYCPMLHSSFDVFNFLLDEYSKDSTTTRQRTDDISDVTGLSTKFVELWFLWRRTKGHYSPGNELLNNVFFEVPYPSDDKYRSLMSGTRLLLSLIQLRFRLMRAKFQVLEFKEPHEKVLWACFMKNPESVVSIQNASDVAGLVGMKAEDVQAMFEYWRMHWMTADSEFRTKISLKCDEICSLSLNEASSDENILNSLEKIRKSQKILGIPTHCRLVKRKKTSGVVTESGCVRFGPYIPQRFKKKKTCRDLITETSSDENIVNSLEKVSQSQEITGIPTHCQLVKRKKTSRVVTGPGCVRFGPYLSRRFKKNKTCIELNVSSRKVLNECISVGGMNENFPSELSQKSDSSTYGLKLQCDILKGVKSSPLPKETDVEPDLRSLFSNIPSHPKRPPSQTDRSPRRRERNVSSSSENDVIVLSSSEESDDSDVDDACVLQPRRPLNFVSEVIDLTLESDSTVSGDDEVV